MSEVGLPNSPLTSEERVNYRYRDGGGMNVCADRGGDCVWYFDRMETHPYSLSRELDILGFWDDEVIVPDYEFSFSIIKNLSEWK